METDGRISNWNTSKRYYFEGRQPLGAVMPQGLAPTNKPKYTKPVLSEIDTTNTDVSPWLLTKLYKRAFHRQGHNSMLRAAQDDHGHNVVGPIGQHYFPNDGIIFSD